MRDRGARDRDRDRNSDGDSDKERDRERDRERWRKRERETRQKEKDREIGGDRNDVWVLFECVLMEFLSYLDGLSSCRCLLLILDFCFCSSSCVSLLQRR